MAEHDTINETMQDSKKKYIFVFNRNREKALKRIAHIFWYLAAATGIGAVLAIFFSILVLAGVSVLSRPSTSSLYWIVLFCSVFAGPFAVISLLALSESIMVFVDMAGNLSEIKRRLADKSD